MKTIFGNNNDALKLRSTAVGLGSFDGLHVGHMALVNTLISEARLSGLQSVIYTFIKHPENILRKKLFTPLLMTVGKKTQTLNDTALDYLYYDEFDEDYSRMEPEAFVKHVLLQKLGAKLIVTGFNYTFGYMGQGDTELLKKLGKKYNFRVIVIPPIKIDGQVVSSTIIRGLVSKGDMESVFKLLGRHYSITGEVQDGRRVGKRIGFPTANLHPEAYLCIPHNGVYITKTMYNGLFYNSLTNIGINPTFGDVDRTTVETHILHFDKNIYKSDIEVFFLKKIRNEKKFKNADELAEQIRTDTKTAQDYFQSNQE